MFVAENHNSLVIVHYAGTGGEGDRRIWSHSVANLVCVKHENLGHVLTHQRTQRHAHTITSVNLSMIKGV